MQLSLPEQLSFIRLGPCLPTGRGVIRFDRYLESRRVTYEVLVALGGSPEPEAAPPPPEYVARESVGPGLSAET